MVADENVEAAKALEGPSHRMLGARRNAYVTGSKDCLDAGANQASGLLKRFGSAPSQHDVMALIGQSSGGCPANPGASAGHKRDRPRTISHQSPFAGDRSCVHHPPPAGPAATGG